MCQPSLGFGFTKVAVSLRTPAHNSTMAQKLEAGCCLSLGLAFLVPTAIIIPAWAPRVRMPVKAEKKPSTYNLTVNLRCLLQRR